MARGEVATIEPADLPRGTVVTTSGRLSGVTEPGELSVQYPFSINDLVAIDDALKYGSRASLARFAIYIGDLGSDTAARAREILAKVPTPDDAVLLAVSPDQCVIEVVYGTAVPTEQVGPVCHDFGTATGCNFPVGGLSPTINVAAEVCVPD